MSNGNHTSNFPQRADLHLHRPRSHSLGRLGSIVDLPLEKGRNGNAWGIIGATWLAGCSSAPLCAASALVASNVKGNTKKSVVIAGFFISYCVGCIVSPQAWSANDAPRYTKGCILSIASWTALIVGRITYLIIIKRINRARDKAAAEGNVDYMTGSNQGGGNQRTVDIDLDLTDQQDKGFRYSTR